MEHIFKVWNILEAILLWLFQAMFESEPEPQLAPASPPPKTVWQPMQPPRAREQLEPRQDFGPDPEPEPRPQPTLAPDDDEDEEMRLEMD